MSHFELFAHGEDFDVDAFLASTRLRFDFVWHRGENCYETSGASISLGDGKVLGLFEQERIGRAFLCTHRDALRDLASYPGVDTFILGLHYQVVATGSLSGLIIGPPPRLMASCLETGVRPVYYVMLEWVDDLGAGLPGG
jgi:hypothetical protein